METIGHDFTLLWQSVYEAAAMFWEVLWALVLGFTLSGIFQVFVSKGQMQRAFGKPGLREVALATAFGAASSSCSYAAVATAKTAFKKGAALVPALAFMFASTNMVFELGLVLWLLMGWRFVLAEFIGAFVLIGVMWLIVRLTLPKGLEREAREHPEEGAGGHDHGGMEEGETWREKIRNPQTWVSAAHAFVMNWGMLWKEITMGFLMPASSRCLCRTIGASPVSRGKRRAAVSGRKRHCRPTNRGGVLRLLGRQYPAGKHPMGRGYQLRRRDLVHLRRFDYRAADPGL